MRILSRSAQALLAIALIAVAATSPHAQDRPERKFIRIKLVEGEELLVTQTMTMEMSAAISEEPLPGMRATSVQRFKAGAPSEGWIPVSFATESADFSITNDPTAADMSEMVEQLKSIRMEMEVSDLGLTRNVRLTGGDDVPDLAKGMLQSLTAVMEQLGFMGLHYPETAVQEGSTWTTEFDMSEVLAATSQGMFKPTDAKLPVNFEILSFEEFDGRPHARILVSMNGTVTFEMNVPNVDGGSSTIEQTTIHYVDLATGLPSHSESEANTVINMGFVEMTQKARVEATLTRPDPPADGLAVRLITSASRLCR